MLKSYGLAAYLEYSAEPVEDIASMIRLPIHSGRYPVTRVLITYKQCYSHTYR